MNLLFIYFGDGVDQIKKQHDQTLFVGGWRAYYANKLYGIINEQINRRERGTCSLEIT